MAGCGSVVLGCKVWTLWRLLLDSSRAATFTVLQNRNQPHPTPPVKPICSNTWYFLLMMGIKMPETCRDCSQYSTSGIDNKHLYCCILLVFFLHAFLSMHGHMNIKNYCSFHFIVELKVLAYLFNVKIISLCVSFPTHVSCISYIYIYI